MPLFVGTKIDLHGRTMEMLRRKGEREGG